MWTYTPFTRADVVDVLLDADLSEGDATAVLSMGIERGILREDGGVILATREG